MNDVLYLGVDPGKQGGIALIDGRRDIVRLYSMPTLLISTWGCFESLIPRNVFCCIEDVHAFPGQGAVSSFTFGENFGYLKMALTAKLITYDLVRPKEWQKGFNIPSKKKGEKPDKYKRRCKEHLRQTAQSLFPGDKVWTRTKGEQMAVCDALLIAEYCRRRECGNDQ